MSLQASSRSVLSVSHPFAQRVQNDNHALATKRLDPLTEQLVKTQDAALEVMHLIETGAVSKFWEEQKKVPSVSWLGNFIDKLMGWGTYFPTKHNKEAASRGLLSEASEEDPNYCDPLTSPINMTTSFDVQKFSNASCVFFNPMDYESILYASGPLVPDPNLLACKINRCIRAALLSCKPNCLPCINATDQERSDWLNTTRIGYPWRSRYVPNLNWLGEVKAKEKLNKWKTQQIFDFFENVIKECDKDVGEKKTDVTLYLAIFIPLATVLGGAGLYVFCRDKNTSEEKNPLNTQVYHV